MASRKIFQVNHDHLHHHQVDLRHHLQLVDPAVQEQMRSCRNKLLPDLTRLREVQDATMTLIGIEREEEEFELCRVDTWEDRHAKKLHEAKESGNFIELLDSDSEAEDEYVAPSHGRITTLR